MLLRLYLAAGRDFASDTVEKTFLRMKSNCARTVLTRPTPLPCCRVKSGVHGERFSRHSIRFVRRPQQLWQPTSTVHTWQWKCNVHVQDSPTPPRLGPEHQPFPNFEQPTAKTVPKPSSALARAALQTCGGGGVCIERAPFRQTPMRPTQQNLSCKHNK